MLTDPSCLGCAVADGRVEPVGGLVHAGARWTVNHRIGASVQRGWLVAQPRRHVRHVAELTPEEWQELGELTGAVDEVLRTVLGAARTYVACFSEDPTWHLHVHLVPRGDGDAIGPRALLGPATQGIGDDEVVQTTAALRQALGELLQQR